MPPPRGNLTKQRNRQSLAPGKSRCTMGATADASRTGLAEQAAADSTKSGLSPRPRGAIEAAADAMKPGVSHVRGGRWKLLPTRRGLIFRHAPGGGDGSCCRRNEAWLNSRSCRECDDAWPPCTS